MESAEIDRSETNIGMGREEDRKTHAMADRHADTAKPNPCIIETDSRLIAMLMTESN